MSEDENVNADEAAKEPAEEAPKEADEAATPDVGEPAPAEDPAV